MRVPFGPATASADIDAAHCMKRRREYVMARE
jgi:hypothetical protein